LSSLDTCVSIRKGRDRSQGVAQLIIDHNIRVAEVASYAIKKIDADYLSEG